MSFTNTLKGLAVGAGAAIAVTASLGLLIAGRLGDVAAEQAYHNDRTYSAVRRMHRTLMQDANYRRLFPEERAKELSFIASLVVHAMIGQVDPLYQKNAINHALDNLVKICSEE